MEHQQMKEILSKQKAFFIKNIKFSLSKGIDEMFNE